MPSSPSRTPSSPNNNTKKKTIPIASVLVDDNPRMATPSSSSSSAAVVSAPVAPPPASSSAVVATPSSSAVAEETTTVPAAAAAVPLADLSKQQSQQAVPPVLFGHIIYQCDNCLKHPILKFRYRCKQCPEYDLCQECMQDGKHDPKHSFEKIPTADIPKGAVTQAIPPQQTSSSSTAPAPALAPLFTTAANADATRPPRRSASTGKGSSENSIERMDEVLARSHVGPLPASHSSSGIATQFLELYDAGLAALERHKKGRPQEQINARIAMALVGIPLRARRGGNFVARNVPQPVDQETVTGVMASLVSQLSALDADRVFSTSTTGGGGEESDHMDFERLKSNVERGVYFRRVESPVMALNVFQKHMFRVWANGTKSGATEDQCHKFDKWSRQALDEVRDGLGLPAQFETAEQEEDTAVPTAAASMTTTAGGADRASPSVTAGSNGVKKSSSIVGSATTTTTTGQPKKSHKKKRDREEMEQQQQQQYPFDRQQMQPGQVMHMMTPQGPVQVMAAPAAMMMAPPPMQQASGGIVVKPQAQRTTILSDADDLRAQIKRMRDDLDDAHSRIDVLIHLLREKIANPLIRGLDRAGR